MDQKNEEVAESQPFWSSRSHALTVVLVLCLLLCAGYAVYAIGQYVETQQSSTQEVPLMSEEEVQAPTPDITSYVQITKDWPVYTDPRQTFQIKYPRDWTYQNTCASFRQFRNSVCIYSFDFTFGGGTSKNNNVALQQAEQGELVVIRSFDEKQYVAYDKQAFCSPGGEVQISNCREDVLRDQKVAIREIGSPMREENVWIIRDDTVIAQISRFSPPGMTEPFSSVMLSTLRFDLPQQRSLSDQSNTKGSCVRAGCSGELCVDSFVEEERGINTTCVFKDEYACLQQAICERQVDGTCGWTQTEESQQCLTNLTPLPTQGF